jgi:protein O-mannosyl-transferase
MPRSGEAMAWVRSWLAEPALIVAVVFLAFWPSLRGDFVWDDLRYLVDNPHFRGFSWPHLSWMFSSESMLAGHYHPLTWMSWALDYLIAGGMHPHVFRMTNLVLHALVCVILYVGCRDVLRRINVQYDRFLLLMVVLLWAVHPLRVESVAWITERRDVLCAVFYLASVWVYVRSGTGRYSRCMDFLAYAFFVISLLCKAWGITLPIVMLIIDRYLGLRSAGHIHLWILARWHYGLTALLFMGIAGFAQHQSGAMASIDTLSISERILQASYAWWFYLVKTILPWGLSPYYGREHVELHSWVFYLAFLGCILVGVMLFRWRRSAQPWVAAIAAYTVIVAPTLGFAQSGPQLCADRYSYLSTVPFFILLGTALTARVGFFHRGVYQWSGAFTILVLAGLTALQSTAWLSTLSMWDRVVQVDSENPVAFTSRGNRRMEVGDMVGAREDFLRARELAPQKTDAYVNLAVLEMQLNNCHAAVGFLAQALAIKQDHPDALMNLATCHKMSGDWQAAEARLRQAVEKNAQRADVHVQLGLLLAETKRDREAIDPLSQAIAMDPRNADAWLQRGIAYFRLGEHSLAVHDLRESMAVARLSWPNVGVARQLAASLAAISGQRP